MKDHTMPRFRKVSIKLHRDEKFRSLKPRSGPDSQKLFMWLLTHAELTGFGAMYASLPGLAHEFGWSEEGLREALREPFRKGMIEYDEPACCLVLPNFLKHNAPENPNVVKGWSKQWDAIPECQLKDQLYQRLATLTKRLGEGFHKAFLESFPKPPGNGMRNQEQEQEQEQEPEKEQEEQPPRGHPATSNPEKSAHAQAGAEHGGCTGGGGETRVLVPEKDIPLAPCFQLAARTAQVPLGDVARELIAGIEPSWVLGWLYVVTRDIRERAGTTKEVRSPPAWFRTLCQPTSTPPPGDYDAAKGVLRSYQIKLLTAEQREDLFRALRLETAPYKRQCAHCRAWYWSDEEHKCPPKEARA